MKRKDKYMYIHFIFFLPIAKAIKTKGKYISIYNISSNVYMFLFKEETKVGQPLIVKKLLTFRSYDLHQLQSTIY